MKYKFKKYIILGAVLYSLIISQFSSASTVDSLPIEKCKVMGNNKVNSAIRYEDSGHMEDWSNFLRPKGNVRTILIPLDTPDSPHVSSIEQVKSFANKLTSEYSRLSHDVLKLDIEVLNEWITLPQKGTDYESSLEWWVKVQDAIKSSDPLIDFSKFDLVIFKHDELSSTVTSAGALPMWTQTLPDGIKVLRGVYIGRDYWVSIGQGVPEAVHEIGHVFGLPDLYMQNADGTVPVGIFDLMSTFNFNYQSQFLVWHQWKLGWIPDENVICASPDAAQYFDFVSNKGKPEIVVIPITSKRLLALELWHSNANDKNPSLIAYTIDTDRYVWTSSGMAGKISPIQMLRPITSLPAPKNYGDLNLGARFFLNDSVKINNATVKVVVMDQNKVSVSYTPAGQQEVASSTPTPSSIPTPSSTPTTTKISKPTTIICTKGKQTKKVTALKPKCPPGYKKK